MQDARYQILVKTPTSDFLSADTFTKEEARSEIDRRKSGGGWSRCAFEIVRAGKYAATGGVP